jgi:enoyl-CoA hydratase
VTLAEPFSPANAVEAGFVDQVVEADGLHDAAREIAVQLSKLDLDAHNTTKLRARHQTLEALRAAIEADYVQFRATT